MQKITLSLSAFAAALLLSSVALADQTVRIPQNQNTFTLQLKANATTGYQWFLEDYNPTYFTYLGYHYAGPSASPAGLKMTGAPGMAEFTFQVNPSFHQGPLLSKIHLVYGQPWDMTASTETIITLVSQPPVELPAPSPEETSITPPIPPAAASDSGPASPIPAAPVNPAPAPAMPQLEDSPAPTMATVGETSSNKPEAHWLSLPQAQS